MKHFLTILLLFFAFTSFAQEEEVFYDEKPTREAPEELEMTNKGVFISTSVGAGMSYRKSNLKSVNNSLTMSIPLAAVAEIGLGRNFRIGTTLERNGNRIASDDSLKIYSINYGLSMALRFGNTPISSFYIRSNFGFSDLQISGVSFYYGNIQDSIVMASKKGVFINLVAGQQIMMQKGVSFFYQAKIGYLVAPEIRAVNFITGKEQVVGIVNSDKNYKLKYSQFLIEVGFTFKL